MTWRFKTSIQANLEAQQVTCYELLKKYVDYLARDREPLNMRDKGAPSIPSLSAAPGPTLTSLESPVRPVGRTDFMTSILLLNAIDMQLLFVYKLRFAYEVFTWFTL